MFKKVLPTDGTRGEEVLGLALALSKWCSGGKTSAFSLMWSRRLGWQASRIRKPGNTLGVQFDGEYYDSTSDRGDCYNLIVVVESGVTPSIRKVASNDRRR